MKISTSKNFGYLLILLAGTFWGTLGVFCNLFTERGFTPNMIAFIRLFTGFLILVIYALITNPKILLIDKKGLVFTIILGLISETGFNLCYFNAIQFIGISSAAILLYLSPLFLLIWSKLFFKEKITPIKFLSVIFCIFGCFLGITGGNFSFFSLSIIGISLGIISAICYSLMSVLSKLSSSKYNPVTIIIYSFLWGWIFLLPFIDVSKLISLESNLSHINLSLIMGLITSSIAYILYFKGIATGLNLSNVGIISSIELVVSIFFATIIFNENFNIIKLIGLLIIISSIIITNIKKEKRGDVLSLS